MKNVLVMIILLIILVSACSPQAQPTEAGSESEEPATQSSPDLTPAERAAISQLAASLGITPEQIEVISSEVVEWPDSCLGIQTEGIACAEVITAGQRIILEANARQVEYRTNEDGSVVLPATVALTWTRSGGIAGFCDNLTVYLSGEVQGMNCKTGQSVEKSLSDLISTAEIATMNDWISKYGVVDIDMSDPKGVADGMSVKLQLMGQGAEQVTSPEVQQVLLQFVQELNQKLMQP